MVKRASVQARKSLQEYVAQAGITFYADDGTETTEYVAHVKGDAGFWWCSTDKRYADCSVPWVRSEEYGVYEKWDEMWTECDMTEMCKLDVLVRLGRVEDMKEGDEDYEG